MKKIIAGLLFLLCASSALAQTSLTSTTCPGSGCVRIPTNKQGSVGIQVNGTFSGTYQFEQTADSSPDAVWYSLTLYAPATTIGVTSGTTVGFYSGPVAGALFVRVRMSVYTSGTAKIYSVLTQAKLDIGLPFNGDNTTFLDGTAQFSVPSGGGSGSGVPGGATNTIQVNAGSGNFGGIALNTTATVKVLEQHSSALPTLITPSSSILSDVAALGLVANPLSQFAATTSAQLASVLSDESGSGKAAFTTSPLFTTPTLAGAGAGVATLQYANTGTSRTITVPDPGAADTLVTLTATQTETNKTFTTPTIGNFTNATHNHQNAAGGGKITEAAFSLSGTSSQCVLGDGTIGTCPGGVSGGNVYDWVFGDGTKGHTLARGTITTSDPVAITQTWNSGAVVFNALDMNITRTASADLSYYMRLRNATTDVFSVRENSSASGNANAGCIEMNGGLAGSSLNIAFSPSTNILNIVDLCGNVGSRGIFVKNISIGSNVSNNPGQLFTGAEMRMGSNSIFEWSTTADNAQATKDTGMGRNAAGVVEVNNGTAGTIRDLVARHALGGGTAPTAGACATSPGAPAGADEVGRIAVGTSPLNTCVVTFGTAYTTAPVCFAENETTSGGSILVTETTSAMTLTQFALSTGIARNYTAADSLAWQCKGY